MNYSYLMGIGNIDILKQNNFKIKIMQNMKKFDLTNAKEYAII